MEDDQDRILLLMRKHVHLTADEIQGYLTRTLDPLAMRVAEEHVMTCFHCARELEIIWEHLSPTEKSQSPEPPNEETVKKQSFLKRLFNRMFYGRLEEPKLFAPPSWNRPSYTKLWIGKRQYGLTYSRDYPGMLTAEGLTSDFLLRAWVLERDTPGSQPFAVEGPGMPPVLALLSDFVLAPGIQCSEEALVAETIEEEPPIRPIEQLLQPSESPEQLVRRSSFYPPRKNATPPPSALELLLTWEGRHDIIELLRDVDSGSVFVHVTEKKGPEPHILH